MKNIIATLLMWLVPAFLWSQAPFPFHAHYIGTGTHNINQTLTVSDTIPVSGYGTIYSLSVSATILQPNESSFVRIVLEDIDGHNYLVAESDRFRNDTTTVELEDYCEETAKLSGIVPASLKCYINNATLMLQSVQTANVPVASSPSISNDSIKRLQVQSIVDRINAYNLKRHKLWWADVTSQSLEKYEDRGEYGQANDPYISNMMYYVDGIYELGEYAPSTPNQIQSLYVDSFTWTKRHGKNWMTIPKHQGASLWCVPFAIASLMEGMTNLYYNCKIDMDLSEADIAFVNGKQSFNHGTQSYECMDSVRIHGVIDELSFPFVNNPNYQHPTTRPQGIEHVYFFSVSSCTPQTDIGHDQYDNIKGVLINNGPAESGITYYNKPKHKIENHAMCLTGYGKVTPNIAYSILSPELHDYILNENHYLIGKTYWEFKDNYYLDSHPSIRTRYFGHEGYMYVVFNDSAYGMRNAYLAQPPITTQTYTDMNIIVEDIDGDGYFNWGVGPRPSHCPSWVPNEPDGDDSDFTKGIMDEYGYCEELDSLRKRYVYIENDTILNPSTPVYNHYVVWKGSNTTICQDATFDNNTYLIVDKGSTLIVDGATISNVTLRPQQGSTIILRNNGKIIKQSGTDFEIPIGAKLEIEYGSIE